VLAAARGGRQLPRPEHLNVARPTLALSLRGWQGGPRPQQHLLAYDGGAALGDRFRTARLLATWVSRSGSSYAPPTSSPPCATVIRFRPPGKFTVAIFLDEQLPARQHLARVGRSMCADECLFFVQ
jgi:hypothetical protein